MSNSTFDFDQIVVGSGFGGSVSALRLSENGHRVLVLEKGMRRKDTDYPATAWDIRNYLWAPLFGLRGPLQMSFTSKVTI